MAFVKFQNRHISYRVLGEKTKPLMVMAHPLGMNQNVWDELITQLINSFRILTWDLPGHGCSEPWPAENQKIKVSDLVDEVLFLSELEGASQFHFIGTSIGGVIGQELIHKHPDRLSSALLTNTGAKIGSKSAWEERANGIMENGIQSMASQIVPRWFSEQSLTSTPGLGNGWIYNLRNCDDRSYALLCSMLGDVDFSGMRAPLGIEITLVGGENDVATPPSLLKELAASLAVAPPKIIPTIGHVPSIESPSTLLEYILH